MGIVSFNHRLRITQRADLSLSVLHMTKPTEGKSDYDVLLEIIKGKIINGSTTKTGFIVGSNNAVCFQDVPVSTYCQNTIFELREKKEFRKKEKYGFFGIMFMKEYVYNNGGRPVLYEKTEVAKKILGQEEWWRIVDYDLTNSKDITDWTHEREWRIKGDFKFDISQATILVQSPNFYKKIINDIPIQTKSAAGIIPLSRLF